MEDLPRMAYDTQQCPISNCNLLHSFTGNYLHPRGLSAWAQVKRIQDMDIGHGHGQSRKLTGGPWGTLAQVEAGRGTPMARKVARRAAVLTVVASILGCVCKVRTD